jgi:hypothetical protein
MSQSHTAPRLRDVRSSCQMIRAHWSSAKRRERRQLARKKQGLLVRWLTGDSVRN